jgi:hypothetical protein
MDILKVEVLDLLVPGRSLQEPTERYDREVKKTAGKVTGQNIMIGPSNRMEVH